MRYPSDYQESNTQPRRARINNLRVMFGTVGIEVFKWMFANPFEAYLPPFEECPVSTLHKADIDFVAYAIKNELVGLAATGDGFQLTAEGRYHVARYINGERTQMLPTWSEERWNTERQLRRLANWEDFDPDDDQYRDGRNPDDREWMSRVQDTY